MLTEKKFVTAKLTSVTSTYYTCPASTIAIIKSITAVKTAGAIQGSLRLHLVPASGSSSESNALFYDTPVRHIMQWDGYQVMTANDTIQGKGNVTIHISGAEIT